MLVVRQGRRKSYRLVAFPMFRKPFLLESGSIPIKRYLSSTPVACVNNLHREPIWIDDVETFPDATLS
jgi:hypothetical protein